MGSRIAAINSGNMDTTIVLWIHTGVIICLVRWNEKCPQRIKEIMRNDE